MKDIEELGPQLKFRLVNKAGVFGYRKIEIPPSGACVGIAAQVSRRHLHSTNASGARRRWDRPVVTRIRENVVRKELRPPAIGIPRRLMDKEGPHHAADAV